MFNKEKFSEILKKIYNTFDNQRDFADATGVNRGYLSRYMNMKISNPPSPKILINIANASKGITTYDELMKICGYINIGGFSDINLNSNEMNILTKMLLDYKEFLNKEHSYERFDDYKYVSSLPKDSREKIIIAFRRNSLDLILNTHKNNEENDYFEFASEDDAMFPLLDVGDIALVYKQDYIEDSATYLINIDNHNTIRKFKLSTDKTYYILSAMNGYYKDIQLNISDLNKIKILGKVIKSENRSAFKQGNGV